MSKPNSAGHESGLQRGDILLDIDTRPIKEFSLEEVKQTFRTESKHPITVDRGGKRVKLVLDLTKKSTAA